MDSAGKRSPRTAKVSVMKSHTRFPAEAARSRQWLENINHQTTASMF
jgi:hypothetical protein